MLATGSRRLDEDDYRALFLPRVGGVESKNSANSAAGFTAEMKVFEFSGFQSDAARKAFGNRTGTPSARPGPADPEAVAGVRGGGGGRLRASACEARPLSSR